MSPRIGGWVCAPRQAHTKVWGISAVNGRGARRVANARASLRLPHDAAAWTRARENYLWTLRMQLARAPARRTGKATELVRMRAASFCIDSPAGEIGSAVR